MKKIWAFIKKIWAFIKKWFRAFIKKWSSRHRTPLRYNKDYKKAISLYDRYIRGAIKLEVFTDFLQKKKEKLDVIIQERQTYTSFLFQEIATDFYGHFTELNERREIERVSDCIQAVLLMGFDPNQRLDPVLSECKEPGNYNPKLDAMRPKYRNTMLHWLIANDCSGLAIKFIKMQTHPDKKIDLNLFDVSRKTPLLFIVGRKYLYGRHGEQFKDADQELIEELVKLDADINIADKICNTPLHIACVKRDVDAVKALLSSSTLTPQSLKAKNSFGRKPTDMLDLSYGRSCDIILGIYDCDIDDIIQKRTVNSPEAEQNAEQIRQLIRDKQKELGAPEELKDIQAEPVAEGINALYESTLY